MFERFAESAKRAVFFARSEATNSYSLFVEPEHLLLGLFRFAANRPEDRELLSSFENFGISVLQETHNNILPFMRYFPKAPQEDGEVMRYFNQIWREIKNSAQTMPKKEYFDLLLSSESKSVLAYAAEEAQRAGHSHIGFEHLIAGLLRENQCSASQTLQSFGLELPRVRQLIADQTANDIPPQHGPSSSPKQDLVSKLISTPGAVATVVKLFYADSPEFREILTAYRRSPQEFMHVTEKYSQLLTNNDAPQPAPGRWDRSTRPPGITPGG